LSYLLLIAYFALHLSCESNENQSKSKDNRSEARNDAALNHSDPVFKPSDLTGLDKTEWEKPCNVKFTLLKDERDYVFYAKETINFSNPAPNGDKITFKFQTRPAMFGLDSNCSKPLSQEELLNLKREIGVKEFDLLMKGVDGNIDFITNKIPQNVYSVDLWSTLSSNKLYTSIKLENDSLTFAETCTESVEAEIKECPVVIGDSPANRGTKLKTESYKRKI